MCVPSGRTRNASYSLAVAVPSSFFVNSSWVRDRDSGATTVPKWAPRWSPMRSTAAAFSHSIVPERSIAKTGSGRRSMASTTSSSRRKTGLRSVAMR
jgi:hypothetical protein